MGKIIAVSNQKGGAGKTTTTINVAAGLARLNKKILAIDLDSQSNMTESFGYLRNINATIYEILKGEKRVKTSIIQHNAYLDIIPASISLSSADMEFSGIPGRDYLLREILEKIKNNYDYIFLDCPPNLGILTINALACADDIIIPVEVEYLCLKGTTQLLKAIKVITNRLNKKLEIMGVVGTKYDSRKKLNKESLESIKKYFGNKVFKTLIRDNISLAEAPSFGKNIFEYKKSSHGSEDYLKLCEEILIRSEK